MKRATILVFAGLLAACSKTPEPTPEPPPAPKEPSMAKAAAAASAASAAAASTNALTEVAWEAPAAWQSMPNPTAMRKATYKIARAAGDAEDAELTVSAAAGGVEPNVKRWAGQFGNAEPKTEKKKVNGLDVTVVEIKGTFSGGGPMMGAPAEPKDKQMLLGAIVDAGDRQHFFKMTGPEKTVTAARPDFDKLVASLHAK